MKFPHGIQDVTTWNGMIVVAIHFYKYIIHFMDMNFNPTATNKLCDVLSLKFAQGATKARKRQQDNSAFSYGGVLRCVVYFCCYYKHVQNFFAKD